MNAQFLHQSANAWVEQAKNDIVSRIREFLDESGISLPQMANDLGLDINELNSILNGGIPSLKTFAILMLANGTVLELKPVDETPLAENMRGGFPMPPADPFNGHHASPYRPPFPGTRPQPQERRSMFDDFHREPAPEPEPVQQQPRGSNGRFKPWPKPAPAPVPPMFGGRPIPGGQRPPFSTMSREQLVDIVQEHLWQDEIDLANISREQLVRFLEAKDRQFNELRAARENGGQQVAIDPSVVLLKEKLKKSLEKNPHLRGFLKDLFEG